MKVTYTDTLEKILRLFLDMPHAFTCNSLAAAANLSALTCKLGTEDEIILPAIMPHTLAAPFLNHGAKPLWCDVRLDGNIDESRVETLITPNTKAILVHDFAGTPANIQKIVQIAKKYSLLTIHHSALGATFHTQNEDTECDLTLFETALGGGIVTTPHKDFAMLLQKLRGEGIVKRKFWNYDAEVMPLGVEMAECLAKEELTHLQNIQATLTLRNSVANVYTEAFCSSKLFLTQKSLPYTRSARVFYPVILNPELHCPKEEIYQQLIHKNIDVRVHYKPLYQLSYYKQNSANTSLHVSNDFYNSELSLPTCNITPSDAHSIAKEFLAVLENYRYRGCSF